MIFDRTPSDVAKAKKIRTEKVQKFLQLSDAEIMQIERGMATKNTLNRIEDAHRELEHFVQTELGSSLSIETKLWDNSQIFDLPNLQRLIDNTEALRNFFYLPKGEDVQPTYTIYTFNEIERILYYLSRLMESAKTSKIFSGEIFSGEV